MGIKEQMNLYYKAFSEENVPLPTITGRNELEVEVEKGNALAEIQKDKLGNEKGITYTYKQDGYDVNVFFSGDGQQPIRMQLSKKYDGRYVHHEFINLKLKRTIVESSSGQQGNSIQPDGRLTQFYTDDVDFLLQLYEHSKDK